MDDYKYQSWKHLICRNNCPQKEKAQTALTVWLGLLGKQSALRVTWKKGFMMGISWLLSMRWAGMAIGKMIWRQMEESGDWLESTGFWNLHFLSLNETLSPRRPAEELVPRTRSQEWGRSGWSSVGAAEAADQGLLHPDGWASRSWAGVAAPLLSCPDLQHVLPPPFCFQIQCKFLLAESPWEPFWAERLEEQFQLNSVTQNKPLQLGNVHCPAASEQASLPLSGFLSLLTLPLPHPTLHTFTDLCGGLTLFQALH